MLNDADEYIPFYGILKNENSFRIDKADYDMTHAEIAECLGLQRGTISEIECRAMKKVFKILQEKNIKPEDFFGGMD
jgi:DNA-binding XRE family transcriptional regulator